MSEKLHSIVVSGAAGFIGSHLCERLLREGKAVIGIDNLITGAEENVAHLFENARFRLLLADICDPLEIPGPVDAVMNLASPASPTDYLRHPIETLAAGSEGTRRMLELAREHDAEFLQASTSETYGDPLEHPQKESYWGNVNPVGPRSCYDESKRFGEALTMAYHRHHGMRTHIARIFNTYGPRMQADDGRVVPAFVSQCLRGEPITIQGSGNQTRSFCYVDDLVDGLWRLVRSAERYPVNLGNPVELTMLEFAAAIRELTGSESPLAFRPMPEDDPQLRRPDITRAQDILGWQPKVALRDGLEQTIADFRSRMEISAATVTQPR